MPKYTLPKLKAAKTPPVGLQSVTDDSWRRRLTIPVNTDILGEAEVGEELTVTLVGVVRGMNQSKDQNRSTCDLTLEITSVECK